jgi:hypothetical protein
VIIVGNDWDVVATIFTCNVEHFAGGTVYNEFVRAWGGLFHSPTLTIATVVGVFSDSRDVRKTAYRLTFIDGMIAFEK